MEIARQLPSGMRLILPALLFTVCVGATTIHANSFCDTCDAIGASDQDAPLPPPCAPGTCIERQFLYDGFARLTNITPTSYTVDWHMVGDSPLQPDVFEFSYTFRPASIVDPSLNLPPGLWIESCQMVPVTNGTCVLLQTFTPISMPVPTSLGGTALEDATGSSGVSNGCSFENACDPNRIYVFDIQVSQQGEPFLSTPTGSFAIEPTATPEPSSLLLMGSGVIGLGFMLKKKLRASA
jgi:hypothetical protein